MTKDYIGLDDLKNKNKKWIDKWSFIVLKNVP